MDYRSIIESAYDRRAWQTLLHDIFGDKVSFYEPPHLLSLDKALITHAWFLGSISLDDGQKLGIYEAELNHVDLERNRVGIRNLLTTEWRNRGFVGAFQFCYTSGSAELRFSYASETWGFDKENKFRKESTDTHRYTYFLGSGHRSRTAIDQFKKLKASDLTLQDITEAFSIEAVSKRFFDDYKRNYEDVVEYVTGKRMVKVGGKWQEKTTGKGEKRVLAAFASFANPEKAVRDYVKKLMGRIVFLQFLQKKGWLGVPVGAKWGEGDGEFLRHLFDANPRATFIDDVLEPLFDDINTRRAGDLANSVLGRDIRVPYLNGGLFERDAADEVDFPLPVDRLEKLFDFFGAYNFTIDENDPEDAEVGVDPEMLSRIFENLLEDNKDKGAFYTPKSIVGYMCRESLSAYLQTGSGAVRTQSAHQDGDIANFVKSHDASALAPAVKADLLQKLREVKICDPAIGSGAFPMGLLKELFACRKALGDPKAEFPSELKKDIIENNIYGVDIEKGAVDIARLRFWLALVVDETSPHALPNLDFKIMQGNSLLESYRGVDLGGLIQCANSRKRINVTTQMELPLGGITSQQAIRQNIKLYYAASSSETKLRLRGEISDAVKGFIKNQVRNSRLCKEIEALGCQNDQFFLWHVWFSDVFSRPGKSGFDIVIGNPPYIKEYSNKKAFDGFRESSPYYQGKMDLWYGFACHGIDLLSKHGVLCFIAQNNWTTGAGASKLRKKIMDDAKICQLVDFNEYMVFDDASIQTMIMIFEKDRSCSSFEIDHRVLLQDAGEDDFMRILLSEASEHVSYRRPIIDRITDVLQSLPLSGDSDLIEKLNKKRNFIFDDKEVVQGIIGNPDDAFKIRDDEVQQLTKTERNLVHKFFTHTERYCTFATDLNVIYLSNKSKRVYTLVDLPEIAKRLKPYEKQLKHRREVENGRLKWFYMHWPRVEQVFMQGPKIVWAARTTGRNFTYTEEEFYGSRNLFYIETNRIKLKFLVGILNSTLMLYYMENRVKHLGELLQLDKNQIANVPICVGAETEQSSIISFVDAILAAKKADPEADTSASEGEIDQLVYKLYGLTDDEIKVVEQAVKK